MAVSVSVVVNVYAHGRFANEAIESVLDQEGHHDVEVILLNAEDAFVPSQGTRQKAAERGIPLRSLTVPKVPLGAGLARGYDASTKEVIALLDDDDCWQPGKLSAVEQAFDNERVVYFHHGQLFVGEDGHPLPATNLHRLIRHPSSLRNEGRTRFVDTTDSRALSHVHPLEPYFNSSSISMRRHLVGDNLGIVRQISNGEDTTLHYCALASQKVLALSTARLTRYRLHPTGMSAFAPRDPRNLGLMAGYIDDIGRRVRLHEAIRDELIEKCGPAAKEFLRSDLAFWSSLYSIALGEVGWKPMREKTRDLLGGRYARPTLKELLTAVLGLSGVVAPVLSQRLLASWRLIR